MDETVEEAIAYLTWLVNDGVRRLQRRYGVTEHSDLNIATGVRIIRALS